MRWTFDDFISQPEWFIELLKRKLIIDADKIKKQSTKYGKRHRS